MGLVETMRFGSLIVVGKDLTSVERFTLAPTVGLDVIRVANYEHEPLAAIGNRFLELAWRTDVVGLCHADVQFESLCELRRFFKAAADGVVCGIVGRQACREYRNRWCHENPGFVSTLDSCSVFLRKDTRLRFDEKTFDSFHCHVEDLCLQARAKGIEVVVPAAKATHTAPLPTPEWQAEWAVYREKLARKWKGVEFYTT